MWVAVVSQLEGYDTKLCFKRRIGSPAGIVKKKRFRMR